MKKLLILPFAFSCIAASGPQVVEVDTPRMPLISATLYFPFGSATETEGLKGATRTVFEWLESGTSKRSADQISDGFLESGARYYYEVDINRSTATLEAPAEYFPEAWRLMLEVLRQPKFSQADLKDVIQKHLTQKKARLTNATGIAKELTYAAIYAGSPEGTSAFGLESDISALTTEKAKSLYQSTIAMGPSFLFVSKSMPPSVRRDVEQSLNGWSSKRTLKRYARSPLKGKSLIIVERPGSTQAYVAFAKKGPEIKDPSRRYVALATELLGGNGSGGGDAILFNELRTKQGLTYHASLQTWRRPDRDVIVGLTFGANENIPKLVGEYLRLWDAFVKAPAPPKHVLAAAERRVNGTAERERATVYDAMMNAIQYGVNAMHPGEAKSPLERGKFQQAKQTWLNRDDSLVLAFGDSKAIRDSLLAALGAGTKVDVLPETADWADINASVIKLTSSTPGLSQ
jgi:predicted Zn-dependent peptidase